MVVVLVVLGHMGVSRVVAGRSCTTTASRGGPGNGGATQFALHVDFELSVFLSHLVDLLHERVLQLREASFEAFHL